MISTWASTGGPSAGTIVPYSPSDPHAMIVEKYHTS